MCLLHRGNLSRKSSQWNEKSLKSNESDLQEEFRKVNSIARQKPELEKLEQNIKGIFKFTEWGLLSFTKLFF